MDKSWMMINNRLTSKEYQQGVKSFLDFATTNLGPHDEIRCPCVDCMNDTKFSRQVVWTHLIRRGIASSYITWVHHGEHVPMYHPSVPNDHFGSSGEGMPDTDHSMMGELPNMMEEIYMSGLMDDHIDEEPYSLEREGLQKFIRLFEDAQCKIYPACEKFSMLSFVIKMLHVKVYNKWSKKSFDIVMQAFKDILPECDQTVPWMLYHAKKFLRNLGLGYETIHACKNVCALFRKENASFEKCPTCDEPRYKLNNDGGKKIPHKLLRAGDSGFNPFENMSTSYSMWPVILMSYNLPPWKCMKESFCMMSLLIPGQSAPGRDIDVYLQPLIEELNNLWECGWSTKGYLACPNCNMNASSQGLRIKIGYMGARRCLPENHNWRRSKLFNGQIEDRSKPVDLSGEEILEQIGCGTYKPYGKHPHNGKRQRNENPNLNWTKRCIMFDLPYWKMLKLWHNLDVMHIEKNICDNVIGTLLSIDGKNKDTDKARLDLEDMRICKELYLKSRANGSFEKPPILNTLSLTEREGFFHFLKSIKYPDGYATNISNCVTAQGVVFKDIEGHRFGEIRETNHTHTLLLGRLKGFVANKAYPEGFIAQAYISKECTAFCSMYLDGVETIFDREKEIATWATMFNTSSSRTMRVEPHLTTVDIRSQWYKDDLFFLPSQVQQVFYVDDTKLGANWRVIEKFEHQGIWDVPEMDDIETDDVFQQEETTEVVPAEAIDDDVVLR
ncbi:uncharacterized protein LOC114309116 [Camellia sinensis]|uniref:uncharacterized protein LOC114309116 n=1 Tax=Camellia sinensis TaxID=4442 RepID=UPI0010355483|nr:uncharacterized protein LOC114309116 [Camellia sinensis]